MAYNVMKKLITNENLKLKEGVATESEYENFKKSASKKLDVFLTCDRITEEQYAELIGLLN